MGTLSPRDLEDPEKSFDSFQQLRQILSLQVSIPFQHLQCLVDGNGRNLHGIQALSEEPACGLVPEIVKVKILDSRPFNRPVEGFRYIERIGQFPNPAIVREITPINTVINMPIRINEDSCNVACFER